MGSLSLRNKPATGISLSLNGFDRTQPVALIRLDLHRTWMLLINVNGYTDNPELPKQLSVLTRRFGELVEVKPDASTYEADFADPADHPTGLEKRFVKLQRFRFIRLGQNAADGNQRRTYFIPYCS